MGAAHAEVLHERFTVCLRRRIMMILKGMTDKKKKALAVLLNEMANADGEFNKDEYRLIFNILLEAGIDVDTLQG